MRLRLVGATLALSASLPLAALAEPLTCVPVSVARCMCAASMQVKCPGYDANYFIENSQTPLSATITIHPKTGADKTIVLEHPKSSARSLYAAALDPEVKAQLKAKKIKVAKDDTLTLTSFVIDSTVKLYTTSGPENSTSMQGVPVATPKK